MLAQFNNNYLYVYEAGANATMRDAIINRGIIIIINSTYLCSTFQFYYLQYDR